MKYALLMFKFFSYLLGVVTVLVLLAYMLGFIGPIEFANNSQVAQQNNSNSISDVCINPTETLLINNLKNCWQKHDRYSVLKLLHESNDLSKNLDVSRWLRHQIDNESYLSFDEEVHLTTLNKILPIEIKSGSLSTVKKDKEYLLNVINSNSINSSQAILNLGHYKDDVDIPIFIEVIRRNKEFDILASTIALATNCSPKAKIALDEALSLPEVKTYLSQHKLEEELTLGCR